MGERAVVVGVRGKVSNGSQAGVTGVSLSSDP